MEILKMAAVLLHILGVVFAFLLLMSIALAFSKKKTVKNIIITSIIVIIFYALISIPGNLNGRLISWPLLTQLFINNILYGLIAAAVADFIIIKDRLYEKKWFLKITPWIGGLLCGFVLLLMVPSVISEQIDLYKKQVKQEESLLQVDRASKMYGFIFSKELITDWCSPYYKLKVYPAKFSQTFGDIKRQAETVLKDALVKNGENIEILDNLNKNLIAMANNIYENDYSQTKDKVKKSGRKYSKHDFCKMIDDKADFHINNTINLFNESFSNEPVLK